MNSTRRKAPRKLAPITRERLRPESDDFRHQIYPRDKQVKAYIYGAFVHHYEHALKDKDTVDEILNFMAGELDIDLRNYFRKRQTDRAFVASFDGFLEKWIPDGELRDEARAYLDRVAGEPLEPRSN